LAFLDSKVSVNTVCIATDSPRAFPTSLSPLQESSRASRRYSKRTADGHGRPDFADDIVQREWQECKREFDAVLAGGGTAGVTAAIV
jgi:hypothetical protein